MGAHTALKLFEEGGLILGFEEQQGAPRQGPAELMGVEGAMSFWVPNSAGKLPVDRRWSILKGCLQLPCCQVPGALPLGLLTDHAARVTMGEEVHHKGAQPWGNPSSASTPGSSAGVAVEGPNPGSCHCTHQALGSFAGTWEFFSQAVILTGFHWSSSVVHGSGIRIQRS